MSPRNERPLDLGATFAGRRVLLTGATGFLGKVALSMLLERYPEVGRIYLLARPGTSRSAEERLFDQVLTSPPFDPVRARHGTQTEQFLLEKCRVLAGDICDPSLGLSAEDLAELEGTGIDVLLNCAGLVTFNPSLELAITVNTLGAQHAAQLAVRLKAPLVHVSTCFVAGERRGPIFEDEPVIGAYPRREELIGEPLVAAREVEDCVRLIAQTRQHAEDGALTARFRQQAVERLRAEGRDDGDERALRLAIARERKLWLSGELVRLGMDRARQWGWPNTYTYSKSLGEQMIAGTPGLRYALARPSIVESALRYPFPGWNEGFTTSAPLAFLGLKGHRSLPADRSCVLDLIPVDLVAAGLLAIAGAAIAGEQAPVYQLASGDQNPFYAARAVELVGLYRRRVVRRRENGNPLWNALSSRLETRPVSRTRYEFLSAPMVHRASRALGKLIDDRGPRWGAPRLSAVLGRAREQLGAIERQSEGIRDLIDLFLPFLWENHYLFRCDQTRALFDRLTEADRSKIPWDPDRIEWRSYFMDVHMAGLERWVFPGLEEERSRSRRTARPPRDLIELFEGAAHAHGARVAFRRVAEGTEEQVSYAQARREAERTAAFLQSQSTRPGDRVLLGSENRPEWPVAYFGILLAGATAVPIDSQASAQEVARIAEASGARIALVSDAVAKRLSASIDLPGLRWLPFSEALAPHPDLTFARVSVSPEDPASIIFTSGTTGAPKGVVLSHRNFAQLATKLAAAFDLNCGDGVLSVLPLHHTFEFSCGLVTPLLIGAEITYLDELTADRLGEVLETGHIRAMVGVPALWQLLHRRITQELASRPAWIEETLQTLIAGNRELRDRTGWNLGKLLFWPVHRKLGGLRVLVSGGAPLAEEVHQAFRGLGFDLTEGYGLTEAAPVITVTKPGEHRPEGSVGKPLPGIEIRIDRPSAGGVGEVLARGPNVMVGYLGDQEGTAATLQDGWLHTGDLGRLDAEGNLHVVGRRKDVIVGSDGKNVYPDELEEYYLSGAPPEVHEFSIVGLSDGAGEERIACLCALSTGHGAPTPDERRAVEDHFQRASAGLPFHKRIKILHLQREALPRTSTRKVQRSKVREQLRRLEESVRSGAGTPATRDGEERGDRWLVGVLAGIAHRPAAELTLTSRLVQDLGFDSLMLTELAVALEQAGVTIPSVESFGALATVGDLVRSARGAPNPLLTGSVRIPKAGKPGEPGREIIVPGLVSTLGRKLLGEGQSLLYLKAFDTQITGQAYIPHNRNFLVASNHASHLDMGLIKIALGSEGQRLCALAARDYFFDTRLKRAYFQNFTRLIPMDRQGSLKASLRLAGEALQQGYHLLIFPEGTRSTDGRMTEFKATLGYLALTYGVDVLPLGLSGTFEALPKGSVLPRARNLSVAIGPPVSIEQLRALAAGQSRSESYRTVTRLIEERVTALLRGEASPPPAAPGPRPVLSGSASSALEEGSPVPHLADGEEP